MPGAQQPQPHPWGPPMRIGKVFIKGNKRTKWVLLWLPIGARGNDGAD